MNRAAIVASVLFLLFSSSCFSELIDPPPLKVARVCGVAMVAGAELELKRAKGQDSVAKVVSGSDGKFDFGSVAPGLYRLSMKWKNQAGEFGGPIQNSYPLRVTTNKEVSCKRPLFVRELSGSESGLAVSFGSEN